MSREEEIVMVIECDEPDGVFTREVRPLRLDTKKIRYLYEKLNQFDVLFNDHIKDDIDSFINSFLTEVNGELQSTGLLWEVDDVGIVYLTDIRPGFDAYMHLNFWDRRLRGREKLASEMVKFVMKKFRFHRIVVEVPLYAAPTLAFIERVGLILEGRRRKVVKYKGTWFDVNQYAIVEDELDGLV